VLYETDLLVPAGTTQDNPAEVDLELTHGVITRIEVEFNYGPNYLVQAYLRTSLHQIWPLNPEGKATGDGGVVGSNEYVELLSDPYVVTCGAYSPLCSYDHTLRFRVELSDQDVAERNSNMSGVLDKLLQLLGVKK